jgi:YD repeat-containing protein
MTGNKTSRTAQFKIDLVNNTPSQPVFSTTVSLFDVTAGSYVDFAANFYPGPGPAVYTITPATPTLNQLRDVTLRLNHTYKLSYGSGQPVTNNVLFTAINWQVPTGTVTYTVNKTDYTGGLRIKSITNDDGLGHTTKKKYGYSKWYYNSNLFNGNIVQMADWFKARTKRWFNMNPQLPLSGDFRWYNAYGENITFQLGSSSNTVVAYEEVEEYAVDALDKPLGKTVSTFNKAADNIPSMAPYFRSDEEWKRSQLANQKVYKTNAGGQFVLLKDAYNQYDYTMMEAVKSFSASLSEDGTSPIQTPAYKECPLVLVTNVYKWMDFDQNVYRSNLISDSTIQYDENGLNPTTLVTQYIYGNPKHNLITRTTKGTSDGKSLVNNLKYPHDYTPSSCVLDICYTNYNSAIANLLAQRKACELTNYNQFASFSDPNSAGANSAFNLYLGCEATYQNQAQAALTTLASCTNTYANCIGAAIGAAVDPNKSLLMMQRDNVVNREVENTSGILINGTEYITAGTRTDFKTIGYGTTGPDIIWGFNSGSFITKAIFDGNPAAYYRKIGNFVSYDNANNVTQKAKDSDFSNSFLWDYNKEYPIAEVLNASADDIAYTSFEADGTGNWSVTSSLVNTAEGRTGNQSYSLTNGSISKYGLLLNKKYTLSFWGKTGASVSINGVALSATSTPAVNGWQYYETTLTGSASAPTATLSGTLTIDELRFFPAQAQMTTYTYDPLRGLTSQTDANSQTTYFEYDAFGRLATMKDSQSNILKTLQYNYKQ